MADRRIQCPVEDRVNANESVLEVNAFRIVPESGDNFFLDFIHYSAATVEAFVVFRVRLHGDVLESTRDRLSQDMVEVTSSDVSLVWPPMASAMVN